MEMGVVYSTKTGNTEKIAKAIGSELKTKPVKVDNVKKATFDFVLIGSGTYAWRPSPEITAFMDKVQAKYAAVFETHGGDGCVDWMEKRLQARGIPVIGRFSCKGEYHLWGPFIFSKGRPAEHDLEDARHFARLMKNKLKNPRISVPEPAPKK